MGAETIFLTTASPAEVAAVHLLVGSLRAFGGNLAGAPFWIFSRQPQAVLSLEDERTRTLSLAVPASLAAYSFADKVAACAYAEQLAPAGTGALVWIDSSCLIVQPPVLFALEAAFDAAFRPVHIQNVGLPPTAPVDLFWQGIYASLAGQPPRTTITSFVDGQRLRSYFNSHAFAINPALGLMNRWFELFQRLVSDRQFQDTACPDELHQIFLFQALLSALVVSTLDPGRVRILPATYNYPYNLHARVPTDRRAAALNDLVCLTYEGRTILPDLVNDIQIYEPLRTWLEASQADS